MTNKYAAYVQEVPGGYRAMIRVCREAKPNPVMDKGDKPKIYPTRAAALTELLSHVVGFMNGRPIRGEHFNDEPAISDADAHFNLKPFVKAKGSNKRTIVEKARRKGKEISVERREMA